MGNPKRIFIVTDAKKITEILLRQDGKRQKIALTSLKKVKQLLSKERQDLAKMEFEVVQEEEVNTSWQNLLELDKKGNVKIHFNHEEYHEICRIIPRF